MDKKVYETEFLEVHHRATDEVVIYVRDSKGNIDIHRGLCVSVPLQLPGAFVVHFGKSLKLEEEELGRSLACDSREQTNIYIRPLKS